MHVIGEDDVTVPFELSIHFADQLDGNFLVGVPMRIIANAAGGSVYASHNGLEGQELTPTVVLIRGGRDVGAWIERPEALATWYRANRASIERGELLQRKTAWYQWDRGTSSMNEIVALAEKR